MTCFVSSSFTTWIRSLTENKYSSYFHWLYRYQSKALNLVYSFQGVMNVDEDLAVDRNKKNVKSAIHIVTDNGARQLAQDYGY